MIDLKITELESELKEFHSQLETANLRCARFKNMFNDAENLNFLSYFDNAIASLNRKMEVISSVAATDERQAEEYQRKLKNFENDYFREYMAIVQVNNN